MVGPRAQRRPFHRLGQIRHLTPQGIRKHSTLPVFARVGIRYHCRIHVVSEPRYIRRGLFCVKLDESICQSLKLELMEDRTAGALTGLSKSEVASQMGVTRVQKWRTDPHAVPPPVGG
jgi:bisphosphoglycerate-dependent phosphoglycerate mutase